LGERFRHPEGYSGMASAGQSLMFEKNTARTLVRAVLPLTPERLYYTS